MNLKINNEHLEYFKKLLQGETDISFKSYWKKHHDYFQNNLPRPQYLRIKFDPIEEIKKILISKNINFQENAQAVAKEKYYFTFDYSVLDENGKLKTEHLNKIFNGAIAEFNSGRTEISKEKLKKFIGIESTQFTKTQIEKTMEIIYFSEIELKYGNFDLGTFFINSICEFKSNDNQFLELKNLAIKIKNETDFTSKI